MYVLRMTLGSALALVIIGVSAFCNWRFGLSLASGFDAQIYALLGASADLFKAIVPLMIAAAWSAGERLRAIAGVIVFCLLTSYSLASAIGLYSQSRANAIDDVEVVRVEHQRLTRALARAREELSSFGNVRLPQTVASTIAAMKHDQIYTRSGQCGDATVRSSRAFCAALAEIQGELAIAHEAAATRSRIRDLQAQLSGLDMGKVLASADPQAAALARLTGLSPIDVRTALALVIAMLIELGSGLGLWLAASGAPAVQKTKRLDKTNAGQEATAPEIWNGSDAVAGVRAWAQARVQPYPNGQLTAQALRNDYRAWCRARGTEPISNNAFGRQLSQIGFQRKRTGGRTLYVGIDLVEPNRAALRFVG